ncbi:hypothetical protein Tco_1136964 [Tanacetum coccineum]
MVHYQKERINYLGQSKQFLYKQETASKSRQARDGKQESSSKSRQARVDKKETGGKQETAIDEKAENTVKECTNWKDKKKDKEQEALLISEDTAFVIKAGREYLGQNPKPYINEAISEGKIKRNQVMTSRNHRPIFIQEPITLAASMVPLLHLRAEMWDSPSSIVLNYLLE